MVMSNYTIVTLSVVISACWKKCPAAYGLGCFRTAAENAAMQHGVHPADWTMKTSIISRPAEATGFGYDWNRD